MAHLRNSNGQPIGTTTTEGETRERIKREDYVQDKEFIRVSNAKERSLRNNTQQIVELDNRLGIGVGANRESLGRN